MLKNFSNSFKILIGSSLILSAGFFVQNSPALAGDFTKTCDTISLLDGHLLRAICKTENQERQATVIDINDYIANIDGHFKWQQRGNYIASCNTLKLSFLLGTTALQGLCKQEDEKTIYTFIKLDEKISNQDGYLEIDRF